MLKTKSGGNVQDERQNYKNPLQQHVGGLKSKKELGNNNAQGLDGESEDVGDAVGKIFWLNCHCRENDLLNLGFTEKKYEW